MDSYTEEELSAFLFYLFIVLCVFFASQLKVLIWL